MSDDKQTRQDTIREAFDKAEAEQPEPEAPEAVEASPPIGLKDQEPKAPIGERPRDEKGRFVAEAEEATVTVTDEPAVDVTEPEPEPKREAKPAKEPPKTWKPAAKEKWSNLDPEVQAEIERRENDIFKGIESYKERAQAFDQFAQAIAPYQKTIQQQGLQPAQAVQKLFQADHVLRTAPPHQKRQYFNQLAQYYGVELDAEEAGDPAVTQLQDEIYALKQQLGTYQQESQQASFAPYINEVERFKADPAHEHFETLRPVMAALIESGVAGDLQAAYDQALYAHPELRTSKIAEQQDKAREEERKRIEAAKRAAVQVKGAPSPAPAKVNAGDRRAVIAGAFDNLDR